MRPRGSRNAGYEARRAALLDRLAVRLCDRRGGWPTLRDLATAAGCSLSTLSHYFGRREALVAAVLRHVAQNAGDDLVATRTADAPFELSVRAVIDQASRAFNDPGILRILSMALIEGLSDPSLGPVVLDTILDPFVMALAGRLDDHITRGEMRATDTRLAALSILSPLLIAALHQGELGGAGCRPLDAAAHARHLAEAFVTAYRAPSGSGNSART